MINILDLTKEELKQWMVENDESKFRGEQVIGWIYKKVFNFDDMKNIPSSLKEKLKNSFYFSIPEIVERYISKDERTIKYLLKLRDNYIIEAVLMKYDYGNTVCLSTQVGCRMGCKFCASTIGGRLRNLSNGEILSEILVMEKDCNERVSNIVLMGTGEPFDNYDNVMKFLKEVNAEYGLNIGQRHITVSTCGIVPKIIEFANEKTQVTLAISLHSTTDENRKKIMPIANKYSIEELLEACRYYVKVTNRRITFEYSLVKGVNDSIEQAKELSLLLKGMLCHVNLIPVNEVKESGFVRSTEKDIEGFRKILENNGIEATVRKEMGGDINAACGQLRRDYVEKMRDKDVWVR